MAASKALAALFPLLGLLAATDLAASPPLGRLFYTPAERAVLDQTSDSDNGPRPRPTQLHYQGLVERRGQAGTLWLNGQAVRQTELPQHFAGTRLQLGAEGQLQLPGSPASRLRPGESAALPAAGQP